MIFRVVELKWKNVLEKKQSLLGFYEVERLLVPVLLRKKIQASSSFAVPSGTR